MIDQLCFLQDHVSVGRSNVQPYQCSCEDHFNDDVIPDDGSNGVGKVGHVPTIDPVHSNVVSSHVADLSTLNQLSN